MKETELRLENYLFFPFINSNVKLCGLPLNQNNSLYIQAQPIDGTVIFMEKIEAFQPIQLTEEILLKIKGFELTYDSPMSKIVELYNHEKKQAVRVRFQKNTSSFEVSFDYQVWNHIKHLHTLQNCFKAKYNEELEINL